jgi:hypothetical protein
VTRRLPLLLGVAVGALAVASFVGTAEAGRGGGGGHGGGGGGGAHFSGGGAHFSAHYTAGAHFGGRTFSARVGGYGGYGGGYGRAWARPGWGYRGYGGGWGVGGRVWVGGYYPWWGWNYPYYYGGYYPEYGVPSYYGQSYYPVQPQQGVYAGPSTAVIVAPHPQLPRFGIGAFYGGVYTDYSGTTSTNDYGLVARFRLTQGLLVEGELGDVTTSVQNAAGQSVSDVRVDHRFGGSLIYEIGAYNRLAPYILGGLGIEQSQVNGSYSTTQDYAELGVGLRLALTPHFHLAFDVRAGELTSVSNDSSANAPPQGTLASTVTPPASNSSNNSEDYYRARLTAIFYF